MSSQINKNIEGDGHSFYAQDNRSTTNKAPSYDTTIGDVKGISNVGTTHNSHAAGEKNKVYGLTFDAGN